MTTSYEALKLLQDGSRALAAVEANGMRIDVPRLDRTITKTKKTIDKLETEIRTSKLYREWVKRFGTKTTLSSRRQLGTILYDVLGYECSSYTATGEKQLDEDALTKIDHPFCKDYLRLEKFKKLHGTYLLGIRREVEGEFLHPSFNLHSVRTFRSSGSDPNFQNIPIRNPEIGKLIRTCFIPRENHYLVEVDYAAIEVRIAACYHKDPTMIKYIEEGYDMHRDMAAECYKLPKDKVPKAVRQQVKALFVFAQFYGDYYLSCARGLWEAIGRYKLTTEDGICLYEHLKSKGIESVGALNPDESPIEGTFEHHIQKVEHRFWNKRFPQYNQWKMDWWNQYKRNGGFKMLTGFQVDGVFSRNEVINFPVQGVAFHCLLWSLVEVHKYLLKHKMKSMVIGQIHDSMLLDVHESELQAVLEMTKETMTQRIRQHWRWINVPLDVEAEGSNRNWFAKERLEIP